MKSYAYLAGLIDGEGTITIYKHRQHQRPTFQFRPRIVVTNTSMPLMQSLIRDYGGSIILNYRREGKNKPCFLWRVFSQADIERVITGVRPYLIIKAAHADLMMRFIDLRKSVGRAAYGKVEEFCYQEIRRLNKRGGYSPETTGSETT